MPDLGGVLLCVWSLARPQTVPQAFVQLLGNLNARLVVLGFPRYVDGIGMYVYLPGRQVYERSKTVAEKEACRRRYLLYDGRLQIPP